MTDYKDLIDRLRAINPRALYSAIAKDSADAIETLIAERDRIRETAIRNKLCS